MMFWYLQRATKAQTSLRKSAFDGSGMSSITAFMLNGLILCLTNSNHNLEKGPFVYKFV